jgi:predicted alpha/beta superfamily hydrolase
MKVGPLLLVAVLATGLASGQSRIDCTSIESHMLHRAVRYCVMLPSSYEKETKKYPVLYFLHGLGENEQALMRSGGWGLIEDLPREHKVGDFIMVAPEGRGTFFINSADGHNRNNDYLISE